MQKRIVYNDIVSQICELIKECILDEHNIISHINSRELREYDLSKGNQEGFNKFESV